MAVKPSKESEAELDATAYNVLRLIHEEARALAIQDQKTKGLERMVAVTCFYNRAVTPVLGNTPMAGLVESAIQSGKSIQDTFVDAVREKADNWAIAKHKQKNLPDGYGIHVPWDLIQRAINELLTPPVTPEKPKNK